MEETKGLYYVGVYDFLRMTTNQQCYHGSTEWYIGKVS